MSDEIEKFRKQHEDSYQMAILDNIRNNTDVLVNQDIMSLLKKPPLDSMDLLRTKFLDLAKKNHVIIDIDKLGDLLVKYRNYLLKICEEVQKIRISELTSVIKKQTLIKDTDVYKFNKKDFVTINKKIKKIFKDYLLEGCNSILLKKVDGIFSDSIDDSIKNTIINDFTKYLKGNYQKQLLENFDIKILVKDTTLINSVKEQGERYMFTLSHSRLLNDLE